MSNDAWSKYTLDLKLVDKARQLRAVVDELKAEEDRLNACDRARWEQQRVARAAMRANPCEATARAVIESEDSEDWYHRRAEAGGRKREALKELLKINGQILAQLGIGTCDEDWH